MALTRDGREQVTGYHLGGEIVGIEGLAIIGMPALSSRSKPVKFAPCLSTSSPDSPLAVRDPEPKYFNAATAAFCGQDDIALQLLRAAVEGNFLCYPAMDRDPMLNRIKKRQEFAAIRKLAIERQNEIVAPWKAKRATP